MSFSARRELFFQVAPRYRLGNGKEKQVILDEFTRSTGYARKYAIRLLNQPEHQQPVITRQRLRWYGPDVEEGLVTLWRAANYICAKRLVPYLPELVSVLEQHDHLVVCEQTRSKLLTMSAATVDRILSRYRSKASGRSTTTRGRLLKHQVKVRTFADWEDSRPGFMEADLVAHCGDRTNGSFLNTLVLTDIATSWTECVPLLCRGEEQVLQALELVRQLLPFPLLGLDTDNGSEFLNQGLLAYCQKEGITFTRSRAYKKNDQCYVEQKNGSIVRQLIGYDRFEGRLAHRQLTELYRVIRLYVNLFQPSMKLIFKKREGAKVTKRYDKAQTPYQRLLVAGVLDEAGRERLESFYRALDPVELLRQLERLQDAFWQHAMQVRVGKIRLGQMPSVRLLEVQSPKLPQAQPIVEGKPERSSASVTVFEELEERGKRRYRRSGKPRVPHTWRTRKDPFEGVWAEVKQKLAAEPERTAKSLFLELQQEYPGRFAAGQLRTLQRRVKQWRRETLITFKTEWLAPELEPLTACWDSSRLGSAAQNGLHP